MDDRDSFEGVPSGVHQPFPIFSTVDAQGRSVKVETGAAKVSGAITRHAVPTRRANSALRPLTNLGGEFLDVIEDLAVRRHLVADLLLGVHDRGVIATEG